jgi:hypothetical protein
MFQDHEHGDLDPHFWQDPLKLAEVADAVEKKLATIDPGHADDYAVNAAANLARTVIESGLETHILCAGTNGLISQEDCLFAGALIDRLLSAGMSLGADDGALLMRTLWAANSDPSSLRASTLAANGGRNLVHLGFTADIDDCLRIGTTELVPRFDPATSLVTAASSPSHVSGASA